MKYFGHWKLLCELSKLSKLNTFILLGYQTNTNASILVYKFRPERTGFNMYAEYTRPQLTFLACHFFDKKYPDLFSMCLKKVSIVKKQNKKLIFFLTFKFLYIVIHLCKRKYFFIKLCLIWVPKNQSWNTEFKNVKIIKICFTWTCYGQIKNWKLGLTWCKQYSYNYLSILQRKVLKQFCYELIWFLKKWLINQWKLFFSLNYFLL